MPDAVPNYLTTNPDGSVGADFTGHIKARGVDLDVFPTDQSYDSSIDSIQWKRTADGAQVAYILGTTPHDTTGDLTSGLDIRARRTGAGSSMVTLTADGTASQPGVQLSVQADPNGGPSSHRIFAQMPTLGTKDILRDDGASIFVQLLRGSADNVSVKAIMGTVRADGSILGGAGYTVSHTTTGQYAITFTPVTFVNVPTVLFSVCDSAANATNNISLSAASRANNGFTALVTNPPSTAWVDVQFDFLAIGH